MPPPESAFLAEIHAAPGDPCPKLVFADWLEEQGDPRAEFIRLQCVLADEAEATMDAAALDEDRHDPLMSHDLLLRSEDLLRQYEAEWVGEIKQ